jgi:hypothetical protein
VRPNLACVERIARRDASVVVETDIPTRGPAAGANRFVGVRFKSGESLAVSEWHDPAAAENAFQKYGSVRPRLSLGGSETTPRILEAWTPDAEIAEFKSCGIGRVEP